MPSHRLMSEVIILALARAAYLECDGLGVTHWICMVRRTLLNLIQRMGIPCHILRPLAPTARNLQLRRYAPGYFSNGIQVLVMPIEQALGGVRIQQHGKM